MSGSIFNYMSIIQLYSLSTYTHGMRIPERFIIISEIGSSKNENFLIILL